MTLGTGGECGEIKIKIKRQTHTRYSASTWPDSSQIRAIVASTGTAAGWLVGALIISLLRGKGIFKNVLETINVNGKMSGK